MTTSPTIVSGAILVTSIGSGSPGFMPRGVPLTTISQPAGSFRPVSTRIAGNAAGCGRQPLGCRKIDIEQPEAGRPASSQCRGNRRANPATAAIRIVVPAILRPFRSRPRQSPRHRTCRHKAGHLPGVSPHCMPGHASGGGKIIHQVQHCHLVRHGDEGPAILLRWNRAGRKAGKVSALQPIGTTTQSMPRASKNGL